jgi:hypothetical protein
MSHYSFADFGNEQESESHASSHSMLKGSKLFSDAKVAFLP